MINTFKLPSYTRANVCPTVWQRLHLDFPLCVGVLLTALMGLVILYSAGNESIRVVSRQGINLGIGLALMVVLAQIPPYKYRQWAPWLFGGLVLVLFAVLAIGVISKGGQRWLGVGVMRMQPSELMKIVMPLVLAWYLADKRLPPKRRVLMIACILIVVPVMLIAKQPDLGTALLIAMCGAGVLLLAGMSWRVVLGFFILALICAPILWHFMHGYQRMRVLTLINPERDPLGAGYHIIQSKIAIGSGGVFGKGWLNGTQSHLKFLPEHTTDFIFAVCGEEFGLMGCVLLLALFLIIVVRGFMICANAQDTFSRLLVGGITLTFFVSVFINIGMVIGLLPVVGLPLPLISYGGSSIVTLLSGFGIIMSVHTHRRLVAD